MKKAIKSNELIRELTINHSEEKSFTFYDIKSAGKIKGLSDLEIVAATVALLANIFESNTGYQEDYVYTLIADTAINSEFIWLKQSLFIIWRSSRLAENEFVSWSLNRLWKDIIIECER